MSWSRSSVIGITVLICGVRGVAATDMFSFTLARADVEMTQSVLKIAKIRLESTPQDETSAVLKFDMSNAGSDTVRAVVFQISLVEDLSRERTDAPERVVAGPFTIEAKFDLEPVETAEYEALLRNLPTDCRCVPRIRVLAVRFFADAGAHPSSVWD